LLHLAKMMEYQAGAVCAVIANRSSGEFLDRYEPAIRRAVVTALEAIVELEDGRAIPPRP